MSRILLAYYSHSGNTKEIAECIQKEVGGELWEILPVNPYPLDYNAVVAQAKQEIQAGFAPQLKQKQPDFTAYDTIFIGSPNWWSTVAPPIVTFLQQGATAGKTILPFITHGGGGMARCAKEVARLCPQAKVLPGFETYGDGGAEAQAKVHAWLKKQNMVK